MLPPYRPLSRHSGLARRHRNAEPISCGRLTLLAAAVAIACLAGCANGGDSSAPAPGAPPIVFNASVDAAPGRVVYLQGANLGETAEVWLLNADLSPRRPIDVVNRINDYWIAARVPEDESGALIASVSRGGHLSPPVFLNRALPYHADANAIAPGDNFRIFGRQLMLPGATPSVTIGGKPAAVDIAHSAEHVLMVRSPASLPIGGQPKIMVDNGNGSGPVEFDAGISIRAGGQGDVLKLDIPWADRFEYAQKVIDAGSGPDAIRCDGRSDVGMALQKFIDDAVAQGGALVRLPAGKCLLVNRIDLKSKVVIEGRGIGRTELRYSVNYPVSAVGQEAIGLRDLSLVNTGEASEGPLWKQNTDSFLQRVLIDVGTSRQSFFSENSHLAMLESQFLQPGSIASHGPYVFASNTALIFRGNRTVWTQGALNFNSVHDAVIEDNDFIRDAKQRKQESVIHGLTLDFAHRISVLGNRISTVNGPITDTTRNDGEAIISEGGATGRTEHYGEVVSAGSDWIDTGAPPPGSPANVPAVIASRNFGVAIIAGKGYGQTRTIVGIHTASPAGTPQKSAPKNKSDDIAIGGQLKVSPAWDEIPDSSSHFATFAWGLERTLIADNQFDGQPRGIWIYQSAARDIDLLRNRFTNGGGIFLRSQQASERGQFDPIHRVRITGNSVGPNLPWTSPWLTYIGIAHVFSDAQPAGTGALGIEFRENRIQARTPNRHSATEDRANVEGYFNLMWQESVSAYRPGEVPGILGTLFSDNQCDGCEKPIRIGSGVAGTTQFGVTLAVDDSVTVTQSSLRAIGTVSLGKMLESTDATANSVSGQPGNPVAALKPARVIQAAFPSGAVTSFPAQRD